MNAVNIYFCLTFFFEVNYKFTLKTPMTCDSANLIYVVICSGCNGEYIGETGIKKQELGDMQ